GVCQMCQMAQPDRRLARTPIRLGNREPRPGRSSQERPPRAGARGATALWPGMQRAPGVNAPRLQRIEALPDRADNSGGLRAFSAGEDRVQDDAESVSPARG